MNAFERAGHAIRTYPVRTILGIALLAGVTGVAVESKYRVSEKSSQAVDFWTYAPRKALSETLSSASKWSNPGDNKPSGGAFTIEIPQFRPGQKA